jgi:hypothetical protein
MVELVVLRRGKQSPDNGGFHCKLRTVSILLAVFKSPIWPLDLRSAMEETADGGGSDV